VVQTQPTLSISANRFTAGDNADEYNGTDSSDETTDNSDDTSSELSSTDTSNFTDTEEISNEPTSKRRKQQTSWPVKSMPMPTLTIEQDITHYIADMTTYLGKYGHLPEVQKAKLVQAGVKGEARDVIMGYSEQEVNFTKRIFRILKCVFQIRERSARNLHQLKQDNNEKVSVFAGRIRRYVRGLSVKGHNFDRNCIEFMKIGALPQIQSRLFQRNPKSFARAIKTAIEAEAEKPYKQKQKVDTINTITDTIDKSNNIQRTVQELNSVIHQLKQKLVGTPQERTFTTNCSTIGNGVKGACFVCHKLGHRYMQCFKARTQHQQAITDQLEASESQRRGKWTEKHKQLSPLSSCLNKHRRGM
jgi:hypothetical protein